MPPEPKSAPIEPDTLAARDVFAVFARHDAAGTAIGTRPAPSLGIAGLVAAIHDANGRIWEQEDLARRRHAPDAEIAANKRAIDRLNQWRTDLVEACDEVLHGAMAARMPVHARLNSESPAQMVDRLSILTLKVEAMRAQSLRADADEAHRERCRGRLATLDEQRRDLAGCFDGLMQGCRAGTVRFKIYRAVKMYNDPMLNPQVYGERGKG
jgi:hypothetical protein